MQFFQKFTNFEECTNKCFKETQNFGKRKAIFSQNAKF